MTQIDRWPEWNKAVESAKFEGRVAKGSVFVWKSQGFTVTSTLQDVEPMNQGDRQDLRNLRRLATLVNDPRNAEEARRYLATLAGYAESSGRSVSPVTKSSCTSSVQRSAVSS